MKSRSVIYVVISFLVVALIYSSFSSTTFQASAAPSGRIGCERTGTLTVKCCQEHIINQGPANPAGTLVNYCTDCTLGPGGEFSSITDCSERYIELAQEPVPTPPAAVARLQESGVLGEPLQNFSQSVGPRWGGVMQTENNFTFSQKDISSNNDSNNTLALDQSDLVSDTVKKPTRTVDDGGEGKDESQTTEEPLDEPVDQDKND